MQGEYESTESRKPVCTVSNENRKIKRERDRTIWAKQVEEMLAVFKLREPTQHTSSLEREVARSDLERKGEEENIPIEEVFAQLRCTEEGLTTDEGNNRLAIFGSNKLEEKSVQILQP